MCVVAGVPAEEKTLLAKHHLTLAAKLVQETAERVGQIAHVWAGTKGTD